MASHFESSPGSSDDIMERNILWAYEIDLSLLKSYSRFDGVIVTESKVNCLVLMAL